MYYCDMGKEGVSVRIRTGYRTLGRYVTVDGDYLHNGLAYRANTIVSYDPDGQLKWYKRRDRANSALLTKEEQDSLVFQILQSEKW